MVPNQRQVFIVVSDWGPYLAIFPWVFVGSGSMFSCLSALAIQWGIKVFSQPPIVEVLPLKNMREACNFQSRYTYRYTSTMTDKMRIVGFLMNLTQIMVEKKVFGQ